MTIETEIKVIRIEDIENAPTSQYNSGTHTNSSHDADSGSMNNVKSITEEKSFVRFFLTASGPPQIFLMTFILALALGSTVGVVPAVTMDRYARLNHGFDQDKSCDSYEVDDKPEACVQGSEDAQNATAVAQLVTSLLTFLTSSLIGSISDSRGRKYIISISVLLTAIAPLVLVVMQLDKAVDPFWYFFAKCMTGFVNIIALVTSSISDVVPQVWRAASFGLILAGTALGFTFSPMFAIPLDELGVSIFSLILSVGAFVLAIIYVPETLPKERSNDVLRKRTEERDSGPVHYGFLFQSGQIVHAVLRPFRELAILNRNALFRRLSLLACISSMLIAVDQALLLFYIEDQLGLNDSDVAILFLVLGLSGILVQGFILKILNDRIGERLVLAVAFVAGVVHNLFYGFATLKIHIYLGASLAPFLAMAIPTISAIKANNVNEFEQGRIQGALYSLSSLSNAVGPIILTYIYHATNDLSYPAPGAFFLLGGLLYLIGCFVVRTLHKEQTDSHKTFPKHVDSTEPKNQNNSIEVASFS